MAIKFYLKKIFYILFLTLEEKNIMLDHSLLLHMRSIIGLDSKSKINGGSFLLEPKDNTG